MLCKRTLSSVSERFDPKKLGVLDNLGRGVLSARSTGGRERERREKPGREMITKSFIMTAWKFAKVPRNRDDGLSATSGWWFFGQSERVNYRAAHPLLREMSGHWSRTRDWPR